MVGSGEAAASAAEKTTLTGAAPLTPAAPAAGVTESTRSGPAAVKHLRARIAAGEDDRMIALAVGPIDFNHVAIAFRLTRFAPDYAKRHIRTRLAQGNGTIDCVHGRIASFVIKPGQ